MYFKFSPSILSRLGEELIPNPDQGILELVKNAYDADATICEVQLLNTESIGGTIIVSDNGLGMDVETLQEGWLMIGKSEKEIASERTPLGRLRVGSKGLGRLAALRQGEQVKLKTRPANKPNTEYSVSICWDDFDSVESVENVTLSPEEQFTSSGQGTEVLIENVKVKLGKSEVKRLAKELLLLADPFNSATSFRPKLLGTGFSELEKQVNEAFFEDSEFFLKASIDENGYAKAELFDWQGNSLITASHTDISKYRKKSDSSDNIGEENLSLDTPYQTITASFELWIFQLNPQSFSAKERPDNSRKIRSWLGSVGGVHFYHRGLRVAPYGDKGDDWLKINFSRSRNPQVRPSTSTIIGRIVAEDIDNLLLQKTDRLGFIENETFLNLQQFSMNVLDWVSDFRLKTVEKEREQIKREIRPNVVEAKRVLEQVITASVPEPKLQKAVLLQVENYDKIREKDVQFLNEELQLYRSLATAGNTAAVFAHESGKYINTLKLQISILSEKMKKQLDNELFSNYFLKTLNKIQSLSSSVQGFANYPIYLLKREKRRSGKISIHQVIDEIINLFSSYLESSHIEIELKKFESEPYIKGSIALLEAILVNLITNSINAFNVDNAPVDNRKIAILTEVLDNVIWIRVMDNALGIQGIELDEIWLPGKTTTPDGTGLGLKIAKDSVIDLGGTISVIANGRLNGAEFIVKLPLK
jgi:signal transduction histidine kinase